MEPAKVLFLNNAVNFGVLTPIGLNQVAEVGKIHDVCSRQSRSWTWNFIILLRIWKKGNSKKTAPGAIIIHFFGGIAEIYFPYVLMNPILLIPAILGGMSGVTTLMITGAGMISPASPGSIFAFMAVTPRGNHFGIILAILVATVVTFLTASVVHKMSGVEQSDDDFEIAEKMTKEMKQSGKLETSSSNTRITKIIFACDAGMGSSAFGASILRKKVKEMELSLDITNQAIRDLDG